eukprot:s661_g21.t1
MGILLTTQRCCNGSTRRDDFMSSFNRAQTYRPRTRRNHHGNKKGIETTTQRHSKIMVKIHHVRRARQCNVSVDLSARTSVLRHAGSGVSDVGIFKLAVAVELLPRCT